MRDPRRYFGVLAAIASGRTRNAQLVLFARRGFTSRLRRRAAGERVLLISAADLFA